MQKQKKLIQEALPKIKKHKKYKSIADEVIIDEIKKYLESNPNMTLDLGKFKPQETARCLRPLIKDIRRELHLSYASFQTRKKSKRKKYLKQNKKKVDKDITKKLLSITLSTKERLENYPPLYKQIFKITNDPKTIIDLGCGLNPTSYPLMNISPLTYFAYDIDEGDIEFLNDYFKIMKPHGLNGKASILNLKNKNKVSKLPSSDIIFLFKVLDIIDKENHKPSEELIKEIISKTRFIVASFATHTFTRKKMRCPKRKWFELMLERLNLKYEIIKTSNEIFYIISQ